MTPLALSGAWVGAGAIAVLLARLRRRRLGWLPLLAAGLSGLAVSTSRAWPGPAASHAHGALLVLGRPAAGLLVAGGVALALTMSLSARLDGVEAPPACLVAAACVVALAATVPVIWALAVAVAVSALALRWITGAPSRATLSAGRVAGLGAAVLLGGAAFLVPVAGPPVDTRTAVAGGLLAGGLCAAVALVPLGGWAPAVAASVAAVDLAPWALMLAPSLLVTAGVILPGLPAGSRIPFANVLLVLGLASAVYGALQSVRSAPDARYARVLITDLALVAAGVGTTHTQGRTGGFVLILAHLLAAPLLLQPRRRDTARPRALAWFAVSGVPPGPAFWGRFLVLEGAAATSPIAFVAAAISAAALALGAARSLVEASSGEAEPIPRGPAPLAVAWLIALAAVVMGIVPGASVRAVFGVAV